jgi:hypothetical protein
MGLRFFHLPKHKQFNMPYRFYDPDKERMQEREERIRQELELEKSGESGGYHANIKGQFRSATHKRSRTIDEARRNMNRRLLYIIIILAILFYLLLK